MYFPFPFLCIWLTTPDFCLRHTGIEESKYLAVKSCSEDGCCSKNYVQSGSRKVTHNIIELLDIFV